MGNSVNLPKFQRQRASQRFAVSALRCFLASRRPVRHEARKGPAPHLSDAQPMVSLTLLLGFLHSLEADRQRGLKVVNRVEGPRTDTSNCEVSCSTKAT